MMKRHRFLKLSRDRVFRLDDLSGDKNFHNEKAWVGIWGLNEYLFMPKAHGYLEYTAPKTLTPNQHWHVGVKGDSFKMREKYRLIDYDDFSILFEVIDEELMLLRKTLQFLEQKEQDEGKLRRQIEAEFDQGCG